MTKPKIVYRLAKFQDRKAISDVNQKSLPVGYGLSEWGRMIAEKRSFVVTRAGLVIGYIVADEGGCIVSFAILEEYRKQGFGRNLMSYCLDHMKKLGHKKIILRVKVSNVGALKLYLSMGFKQAEVLNGYYSNNEDGYLMQLDLN